jgi:hypothetical protein
MFGDPQLGLQILPYLNLWLLVEAIEFVYRDFRITAKDGVIYNLQKSRVLDKHSYYCHRSPLPHTPLQFCGEPENFMVLQNLISL